MVWKAAPSAFIKNRLSLLESSCEIRGAQLKALYEALYEGLYGALLGALYGALVGDSDSDSDSINVEV